MSLVAIRRHVPNDHSCLFWALAYAVEGSEGGRKRAQELREVCAEDALKDPDAATRALLLGHDSVEAYATWIRNEFHWGGENEVHVLAKHFGVEVAVVCCESLRVLCYGAEVPGCTERVHLLYTGQHYDPLVGGTKADALPSEERRRFAKGDSSLEASALEVARTHNADAAKRAAQRRVKRIKCGGCGTLVADAEAFATHCSEVEHSDDFAYDCEEVEVVLEGGEPMPEGTIDLSSDSVHTFYNTAEEPLSPSHMSPVQIDGRSYPSLEHYWQCAPFLTRDAGLVDRIVAAPTAREATLVAGGASHEAQRPDWRECREAILAEATKAKFRQHVNLAEILLATGDKTLVCIDMDPWAGMQSLGGIPTGHNNIGKALMTVREGLRAVRGSC